MKRRTLLGIALGCLLPGVAGADDGCCHQFNVDYHRNIAWPQPFRETSAMQTREYFQVISQNGWRAQNSLGSEVFRAEDQMLTLSGQERLRRIVQSNPEDRRVVFVYRGRTPVETEARLAMVRKAIEDIAVDGPAPPVMITDIRPPTSSGAWVTNIQRERVKNLPPPVLPEQTEGSSSSQ